MAEKQNTETSNESMLLENVFLKFGLAETDEQLEKCLSKFLCPVLLKLTSKQSGVQGKVMEMLGHISKRLKSRSHVQLPVDQLVAQYVSPETAAFVTNFTIIYLKIGFPRLTREKQLELMPALLKTYQTKPIPQQSSILQLLLPCFDGLVLPKQADQKKALLGIDEKPDLVPLLLEFMLDVLFLPYNYALIKEKLAASKSAETTNQEGEPVLPPSGLDEVTFRKLTEDNPPSADQLEKIKLGILSVLGGDIFEETDVVCHLIIASADTRHSVASAADKEIKRIVGNQDWNNTPVIRKMYAIFQGTVPTKAKPVKPEQRRTPANVQTRLKIFPYLLKSKEACRQFPACLQVTCDCLFGKQTNNRLKHMAVQFVHHLCLNSPDNFFKIMAPVLLSSFMKLIKETTDDVKLRAVSYVATAKIASRLPQLVSNDVGLLQTFFDAVCKEESENRLAVQEALSMMSRAFTDMTPANQKLIEALILQNAEKTESQARLVAVQYAHAVFPADHIPSRCVLLLACGDRNETVAAEARKALIEPVFKENEDAFHSPAQKKRKASDESKNLLPSFSDMVVYIQAKAKERMKSPARYTQGNHSLPFHPTAYTEIVLYLQACLTYAAGVVPDLSSERDLQEQAPYINAHVNELLSDGRSKEILMAYISMLKDILTVFGGSAAMFCLLQMVAIARDKIAGQFTDRLDWIKGFLHSSRADMRRYAAELYALVIVYGTDPGTQASVIDTLLAALSAKDNQAYISQHGSLHCLGYVSAYLSRRRVDIHLEDMETDSSPQLSSGVTKAVKNIAEFLDNEDVLLSVAACASLGELGRAACLPLPDLSSDDSTVSKESIVDKLIKKVKADNTHIKLREAAATTLGYLCTGQSDFPFRKVIIEGLLESSGPKQIELHMTIGEALVCAALASNSPEARDYWMKSRDDVTLNVSPENSDVATVLKLLLTKYIPSLNPHTKQAACIWLLALTKQCGTLEMVQANLLSIQSAFMSLLSESDEITQDLASKGLGIVYEKCGQEQKKTLVSSLVDTLSTGKKQMQKVDEQTQLFESGALGKTPDGKSLTTYKELCSIANDLNQPDLIYKFMHLANHQAMWNSKKGAAFGFSTIAAQAGEQLAPYLHQIVPKLYRYQFDPNAKIQLAMSSIWNALVTDSKKTVDKYEREIMADLLVNLTNVQWRVRESSCIAVSDFLRGRPLDGVVDDLPRLWESCFRVLDDIKESVRKAAEMASRSLSKASIKICDPEYGKIGEKATSLLLPCLINTGLVNQVKEVRAISLVTLLKISKSAGAMLKPHIPLLVYSLLEALSSLEPQYLNYVSLHVASTEDVQNKLDSARAAASKTSPMMEVVNLCVPYIDDGVLKELVPRLTDLIKSGVGLSTKTGCADFIIQLSTHCSKDLQPYAGKLLLALLNGLNDRNVTVKKRYGSAIGHLVRVAKESSVEKLILKLKGWYLEKEDESVRQACAVTLQAITRRSPDVTKAHGAVALPLAFLGMHEKRKEGEAEESSETSASVWEEVWAEATPGTEAGVRLYLQELVDITQVALTSQSWHMKAQGAATMATIATQLGSNLGPPHLGILLTALLSALSGRTWTGKEALLKAISTVCVSCKKTLQEPREGQPKMEDVLETLLKECRKENILYKLDAIQYTGEVIQAHEMDRFKEISEILFPMLEKRDDKDEDIARNTWLLFEEKAFQCLCYTWPAEHITQENYYAVLHDVLLTSLKSCFWRVEVEILKAYQTYLSKLYFLKNKAEADKNETFIKSLMEQLIPLLCKSLGNSKYGSVRTEAMSVLQTLFETLQACDKMVSLETEELTGLLRKTLQGLGTDSIPGMDAKAQALLKRLDSE